MAPWRNLTTVNIVEPLSLSLSQEKLLHRCFRAAMKEVDAGAAQ